MDQTFTYGYSVVGEVIKGSPEHLGKIIHIMHPHQDFFNAKSDDLTELPLGLTPKTASMASNMETAVNAIWDAEVELGDRVLIVGFGVIGALVAEILQNTIGVSVEVLEKDKSRADVAKEKGLNVWDKSSQKFDVVFNTSSNEEILQNALTWTTKEGRIVELSWYGSKTIKLQLGTDFHYGRKKIIGSQVSQIPSRKQPQWNYKKRKDLVFELLSKLDLSYLTSNQISFSESVDFYARLRRGEENNISTLITY